MHPMRLWLRFEDAAARHAPPARPAAFLRSAGIHPFLFALLLLPLLLVAPRPLLYAQESPDVEEEPIVVRITFDGADAVSEADLQASIATEASGCRSLLLRPFCLVADWPLFVAREVLDPEELQRDVIRLRVFYFRQGYREAAVTAELVPAGDGVDVVFHIEEGAPTVIDDMEIRQSRDVLSDRTIRRARLPGEGDVLNLDDIELGMTHLEQRLGADGYLDAELRDSMEVDAETRRARAAVVIEPGPRSTVERIDIRGNQAVDDATIAHALRLRPGRVLRASHILAARRSLYESNLFHEVDVAVPEQPDSAKRVEVEVREAPPRSIRAGGGFNTIEFVQTEASYTHYNWLGGGRRLEIRGTAGNLLARQLNDRLLFRDVLREGGLDDDAPFLRPTWQASIGFMQPSFPSAATVAGVEVFANRRTIPGIAVDRGYGGDVSLTRRLDFDSQLSLTFTYERTSVEAGDLYFCVNYAVCDLGTIDALRGSNAISPAAVAWRSDEVDNPIAASSGHRLHLSAEHASGFTASDFRYNRIAGDGQVYFPLDIHRRRVVAGRLRVGWVRHLAGTAAAIGIDRGGEDALLHPRKRFFAGGSQSVRGYGENQLGPKILTVDPTVLFEAANGCTAQDVADRTCDPHVASMEEFFPQAIGGTTLLEASVEYRFPFLGGLTAAVFLDGAIVGEGIGSIFSDARRAVTPGVGVRLATPVGPVRIDLGFRPNATERLPVVTEVLEENGDRRLVELEARRRYNPVQAAGGGFLSEVFSRMALHLSIGEAY